MRKILAVAIATVVVGATLVGSYDASAGGGCHQEQLTDESGTHVEMSKRCFSPTVIRVPVGDDVTWTNSDPDAHTVTGVANSWGTYDELLEGDSVSYSFEESGVFPYFCVLHPSMVGAVVAGDGSAASSTDGNGGVKAVSAEAPGGNEAVADERAEEAKDGGPSGWLIGGLALAVTALTAALFLSRKVRSGA